MTTDAFTPVFEFSKILFFLLCFGHSTFGFTADNSVELSSNPTNLHPNMQLHLPLNLNTTVKYALDNSPTFSSARKTQTIRDLEYSNSLAKLLPSFDFSTTNGLQNNIPFSSSSSMSPFFTSNPTAPWFSSVNLGISETLYDNGVSFTNIQIAELNQELARINYLKARDSLVLEVTNEFYRFSLATELLTVRKQQQAVLLKQFDTLSGQFHQGLKTKSDFLRLKTQLQRAEIERNTAANNIQQSSIELHKLLGVSVETTQPLSFQAEGVETNRNISESFPQTPPPLNSLYDYRIKKVQGEVNEKSVTLAKRKYWPQVILNSGISYTNQNYLNASDLLPPSNQVSWNALLTLQYNIWDWGLRKRDVEIARLNLDVQENALTQTVLETSAKSAGIMADIVRIQQNFKLSRELLSLETESNRNLEVQYREGKVVYLDLITSLNSLLDAKVQFFTAYFEALQTLSKYRFYEGKLYDSLFEK